MRGAPNLHSSWRAGVVVIPKGSDCQWQSDAPGKKYGAVPAPINAARRRIGAQGSPFRRRA